MMNRLVVLVAALCALAGAAFARGHDDLPPAVAAALAQAGLPGDAFAAVALPRTRWARDWRYRAEVPVQPGSTIKLLTSIVALDRLGGGHRGHTELHAAGRIEGGELHGDLVLVGGADPELDLGALLRLLHELRERHGVHTLHGRLLLDRSRYRPARLDLGVPPFDDAPEWPYSVTPDALQLAGNLVEIELDSTAAAAGGGVQARLWPPLAGVSVDATALAASETPCSVWSEGWRTPATVADGPGQWRIVLAGVFPRGCQARAALQLLERDVLADRLVRSLWASLGGRWTQPPGRALEAALPAGATLVARRESRPWGELLRRMNKASDNVLARLLFLELGVAAEAGGGGETQPTLELAWREVERWLDERGIARDGLVLDNGSGLSRRERIAPLTLARAIESALDGRHAADLLASLPVAGVDGTLRRRLQGTPAEGWARLKTGALANVAALAGTVHDSRGDTWVVVAIVNHEQARRGWPALEAFVTWVTASGARWR